MSAMVGLSGHRQRISLIGWKVCFLSRDAAAAGCVAYLPVENHISLLRCRVTWRYRVLHRSRRTHIPDWFTTPPSTPNLLRYPVRCDFVISTVLEIMYHCYVIPPPLSPSQWMTFLISCLSGLGQDDRFSTTSAAVIRC